MGTAVILDDRRIKELYPPSPWRRLTLEERAERIEALTRRVEQEWPQLSRESREALVQLAELALNPPRGVRALGMILWLSQMASAALRGEVGLLYRYLMSTYTLVDAVLNAREREDPEYGESLRVAIDEALGGGRPGMNRAEFDEWAKSV